jgi:hypothetical protein
MDYNKKGIIVCLGWVARKNIRKDLNVNLTKIEIADLVQTENMANYEKFSGHCFDESKPEFAQLRKIQSLEEVEGILRKEEKNNFLLGKTNNINSRIQNKISLKRMIGFFDFSNNESKYFYLDRIGIKQDNENIIPLDPENLI